MPDDKERLEWLETDGLGGFASGTAAGIRTRRYHALLLSSCMPPTSRVALVNDVDTWVSTASGSFALSSHRYRGGVVYPDGAAHIVEFEHDPWPTWRFRLADGTEIVHGIMGVRGMPLVVLSWRLLSQESGVTLDVRPLLSGRDMHALHQENRNFRFDALMDGNAVSWRPYDALPAVRAQSNGVYEHAPDWYRSFSYTHDPTDSAEDLASPGVFHFDLGESEAILIFAASTPAAAAPPRGSAATVLRRLRALERERRSSFPSALHLAADDFLVRRGAARSIIAAYPTRADRGRDACISVRGLCLETGRLSEARQVLLQWASAVSEGMLPSRYPEVGQTAEYDSADASLWFLVAVHDFLASVRAAGKRVATRDRKVLDASVHAILDGYARGTRHAIHADSDGLLAIGDLASHASRAPLTWQDSKRDGIALTPRVGKPVEIEALWLNALRIGSAIAPKWGALYDRAERAFATRFWNETRGALFDVVDVDHVPGTVDDALRPNQIFAVGGLPFPVLDLARSRRVVDIVQQRLWTPGGLRSLAEGEPGYTPYFADAGAHDQMSAHMGAAWPWLMGPFVEAWLRVHGSAPDARREARERFVAPLIARIGERGLGHLTEIVDAAEPWTGRGAPFQALALGELLRMLRMVREQQHPTLAELASTLADHTD